MKLVMVFTALLAATLPGMAQRYQLPEINATTAEGKLLQAITGEPDGAKKVVLLEQFSGSYAKHGAMGWVWSQLQQAYFKAGNFDSSLAAGEKLLGLDAKDWEAGLLSLQAAVGKKDTDTVLKLAPMVTEGAQKAGKEPRKAGESDEQFQYMATLTRDAVLYAEYAYSAVALAEQNPGKAMQVIEALEKQNPASQYFGSTVPKYVYAARQGNQMPALMAFGERAWGRGAFYEDVLLTMADYHMQTVKDPEKVILYGEKAGEVLSAKAKPEGMTDADWEKKKGASLGLAYWMAGTTLASQNKNPQADKDLRAALPHLQDNLQLNGTALFYLGLVNYQMGKGKNAAQMTEAVSFMQRAAAIPGPLQAKAQQNLALMKREAPAPKKK